MKLNLILYQYFNKRKNRNDYIIQRLTSESRDVHLTRRDSPQTRRWIPEYTGNGEGVESNFFLNWHSLTPTPPRKKKWEYFPAVKFVGIGNEIRDGEWHPKPRPVDISKWEQQKGIKLILWVDGRRGASLTNRLIERIGKFWVTNKNYKRGSCN